jgi:hypothetical protein
VILISINEVVPNNPSAVTWYNMLNETEKEVLKPILEQVIFTTKQYNQLFPGFEIYITGSSLNMTERTYNDIDIMVVIPEDEINNSKRKLLSDLWEKYKNKTFDELKNELKNPKVQMLGLNDSVNSLLDSLKYSQEIHESNKETLITRLGSESKVHRLLMDPELELEAIKVRTEGIIESEKPKLSLEADGSHGYMFGPIVEMFLKTVTDNISKIISGAQPVYQIQWHKSFSEGYGKIAGENNCHIYSKLDCPPAHIFVTTGVDLKKAMEKKESFMLAYYTEQERMQPIKLY